MLSLAERDRRWRALGAAVAGAGLDGLLVPADDYRGHRGALRYLTSADLCHKFGFGVFLPGREPIVVLPRSLADARLGPLWTGDVYFADEPVVKLNSLFAVAGTERLGVVGFGEVLRAADLLALQRASPPLALEDATPLFESVRMRKSPEEHDALAEAMAIAEAGVRRVAEVARPGRTERELAGEALRVATALGAGDTIFLTMHIEPSRDGGRPTYGRPSERPLRAGELFTLSIELTGSTGYWVELARAMSPGTASAEALAVHEGAAGALRAAAAAAVPGASFVTVAEALAGAAPAAHEAVPFAGHGIGLDVIEWPVGAPGGSATVASGAALALHPQLFDRRTTKMAYLAETYVVGPTGASALSKLPLEVIAVARG